MVHLQSVSKLHAHKTSFAGRRGLPIDFGGNNCCPTLSLGENVGGTEQLAGELVCEIGSGACYEECAQLVHQNFPKANAATWGNTASSCYAEFGAKGPTDSQFYNTCFLRGRGDCYTK